MARQDWHLDKKVSIGFLCAFIGYGVSAIWFAAGLNARVGSLESNRQNSIAAYDRLIRLETNFDNMKDAINRIDTNLAKLAERNYDEMKERKR